MKSIEKLFLASVGECGYQLPETIVVTRPDKKFGDFATPLALSLAKEFGESPLQIAEKLSACLKKSPDIISADVAGPGFVNIKVSDNWFNDHLSADPHINPILKSKKYLIEYSSPNIAKPMHVGHLRTTVLGQTLVNLYRALGAEVCAWSHPGDWGVQFGKLIVGWKKWGDKNALEKNPIDELLRVYVKFHQEAKEHPELDEEGKAMFKALQDGDAEVKKYWEEFTVYSQKEFDNTYKRLRVKFDVWRGESEYNSKLQKLVDDALECGVAKISDGAVIIPLDKDNLPPFLIRKSDGATLYATAEMVSAEERTNHFNPEEIICVVGNEQTLHMQQSFVAAQKLADAGVFGRGFVLPKLTHVSYGFFRLTTGKMSTRAGELIRLDDVLDEAVSKAHSMLETKNPDLSEEDCNKLAEELGIAAVKYTDLVHERHTDVVFDWDKMFSLDGNSIIYLFYTNARCNSLIRESTIHKVGEVDPANEWSVSEKSLLLTSLELDSAVQRSVKEYDPHFILEHAYKLSSDFSRFYNNDSILKSSGTVRERRLKLVRLVQRQLKFVFDLLGVEAPERL